MDHDPSLPLPAYDSAEQAQATGTAAGAGQVKLSRSVSERGQNDDPEITAASVAAPRDGTKRAISPATVTTR